MKRKDIMRRIPAILALVPLMIMLTACEGFKIKALKYEQFGLMQKAINDNFGPLYKVIHYEDEESYNTDKTELTVTYRLSVDRPLTFDNGSKFAFDMNFGDYNEISVYSLDSPRTIFRGNMVFQKKGGAWFCAYNTITDPANWEGIVIKKMTNGSADDQGVSTQENVYLDDGIEENDPESEEYCVSERGNAQGQGSPQARNVPDRGQIYGTPPASRPQTAYAVTGLQDFVTARPGARGSSTSSGPGTSGFNPQASSGFSGSFDPNATSGFNTSTSNVGRVLEKQPGGPGLTTRPNLPTQTFTGDASRLQTPTSQWPTDPSAQQGAERVTQPVVQPPEITNIHTPEVKIPKPASSVPDADIIYNQIAARKGQIEQSYKQNVAIKKQTGSITVLMDIAENGSVSARVTSNSATFTQSFLGDIKRIVESWRFNVSKPTKYQFKMNLTHAE